MVGARIAHMSRAKSAFIEFFFKPGMQAGALFLYAWMKWASPPKSYNHEQIMIASTKAVKKLWGNSPIMEWKMYLFSYVVAAFCEADNAYSLWFFEFAREIGKIGGVEIDKTDGEAKRQAKEDSQA